MHEALIPAQMENPTGSSIFVTRLLQNHIEQLMVLQGCLEVGKLGVISLGKGIQNQGRVQSGWLNVGNGFLVGSLKANFPFAFLSYSDFEFLAGAMQLELPLCPRSLNLALRTGNDPAGTNITSQGNGCPESNGNCGATL